jgi:hypothetical protein
MKSDEELLLLAHDLHARGELSVERMKRAAGGEPRERLSGIVKQVRTAAAARQSSVAPARGAWLEQDGPQNSLDWMGPHHVRLFRLTRRYSAATKTATKNNRLILQRKMSLVSG